MSKAFYIFLSELREDGYNAYALRQKKVDDLKILYSDVTDQEKKIYDHYIEKMKKHPLYKLKLPELQKMVSDKGLPYTGLAKVELIEALSPSNFIASLKTKQKIRKVTPPSDQPIKKVSPPSDQQKSVKDQPSTSSGQSLLKMIGKQPIKKVSPPSDQQKCVMKDQPSTSSGQSLLKMINQQKSVKMIHQKMIDQQPSTSSDKQKMIDQRVIPPSDQQKSVKMIDQQPSTSSNKQKMIDQQPIKKVSPPSDQQKCVKDQPIKKVTPPSDQQKSVKDQPSTSSDKQKMIDQQPSTSSDQSLMKMINQQKKVPSSDLVELTDEQKKVIDSLTDDGASSIDVGLLDAHYLEMINLYCKDVKTVKYHPVSCHLEATSEEGSLLIMGVKMTHQKKMINDRLMKAAIF